MSESNKIKIEIDLDEIKKACEEYCIRKIVDDYFYANDVDWNDRKKLKLSDYKR